LQNVQLLQGGQNPRGSGTDYKALLEKLIIKDLLNKYRTKVEPVVIQNDVYSYLEVEDLDVSLDFLRIAFGDFRAVTVSKFGVHVSY
jgi:hypothetical protein